MIFYASPDCLLHDPAPQRGFAPARLKAVLYSLGAETCSAQPATRDDLLLAHLPAYIDSVLAAIPPGEDKAFDQDTFAMEHTGQAALAAAGLALQASKDVMSGKSRKAFVLPSPGGHHAEADCAVGFCFFNHIALAALAAQDRFGAQKIAVLDIDAHHGNGTQNMFWNHADRLFVSLHEESLLTGFPDETGAWDNVLNLPLPSASGADLFRQLFTERAAPKIRDFAPDILFVSAGFDAHREDPLSSLILEDEDYAWLGAEIAKLADEVCHGRLVGVLEGGYSLDVLGRCVRLFLETWD